MDFNDYHVYDSPKGVLQAIEQSLDLILEENIDLYWIEGTWMLIGVRNLEIYEA
jgi:hypothetical protein